MAKESKRTWGGARKGAGRPRLAEDEKAVKISASIPPEVERWVRDQAEDAGTTMSKWIAEVLVARWRRRQTRSRRK